MLCHSPSFRRTEENMREKGKEFEKFDIIDVNMGCPVKKIVSNGEGSALLKNPALAAEIVRELRRAEKPVTVKFRIGF